MKKEYSLLLILMIFLHYFTFGQTNSFKKLHGTLIIAAICPDGILIESDSRLGTGQCMVNNKIVSVAYSDSNQKIYLCNKYAIAFSGTIIAGNLFVKNILAKFKSSNPIYTDPLSFLKQFSIFLQKHFPEFYKSFSEGDNKIICCGYYNAYPMITGFSKLGFNKIETVGGYLPSRYLNRKSIDTINSFQFDYMEKALQNIIEKYPGENDVETEVGGPTIILKMSPKQVNTFKQGGNFKSWLYFTDYIKECFKDKISLTFVYPQFKDSVLAGYKLFLKNNHHI